MALCTQREKKRAPTATDGEKSGNRKAAVQSWSYVETFPPKIRPTRILPVVSPALVHFFPFFPSPISSFHGSRGEDIRKIVWEILKIEEFFKIEEGRISFFLFLISLLRIYVVGASFEEKV